jgi:hypothetical protein
MTRRITGAAVARTALLVALLALGAACGAAGSPVAALRPQDRPPAATAEMTSSASPSATSTGAPPTGPTGPPTTASPAARPVTAADRALVAAFLRFAHEPSAGTAHRVRFAGTVRLGLSGEARRVVPRRALADRGTWRLRIDPRRGWRGRDGAVDVLALARTAAAGHDVTVGPHRHCASPPVPAPRQTAGLRRVALQPRLAADASCLDWWTVDLFVDGDGRVRAVTADVWEP